MISGKGTHLMSKGNSLPSYMFMILFLSVSQYICALASLESQLVHSPTITTNEHIKPPPRLYPKNLPHQSHRKKITDLCTDKTNECILAYLPLVYLLGRHYDYLQMRETGVTVAD